MIEILLLNNLSVYVCETLSWILNTLSLATLPTN